MGKTGLSVGKYKREGMRYVAKVFFQGKLVGFMEKVSKDSWHPRHGPTVKPDGWEFTPINGGKSIRFLQDVEYRNLFLLRHFTGGNK